jgi:opacity protein-like surface antigen
MVKPSMGVAVLLFALGAAQASAQPMLQKGVRELSIHVSPDFEGAIGDMLDARAGFALFVRDGLSARAILAYAVLEDVAGEDSDYRMSQLTLAAEQHFRREARLVPYLGFGVGWRSSHFADLEESALVYGPRAGLKYFIADNVALDFEVTYELSPSKVFINDFVAEDTDISSGIGLRVLF